MSKFPRPELLLHSTLPKLMWENSPRLIMGNKWWDEKRNEAYKRFDYRCWACGVHKSQADYKQWLEAHEAYKINSEVGYAELEEIVALCYSCHLFIHKDYLHKKLDAGEISKETFEDIIAHGQGVLRRAGYAEQQIQTTLVIRENSEISHLLMNGRYYQDGTMVGGKVIKHNRAPDESIT